MPSTPQRTAYDPLIIVFGDLHWLDAFGQKRTIEGLQLFNQLTDLDLWFSSRQTTVASPTKVLLFKEGRSLRPCGH